MALAIENYDTFPKVLVRNAKKWPDKAAIREKDYGIWQTYTWGDYLRQVKEFTLGLKALGFGTHDKLGIVGDNRPQLYWGVCAAQCLRGTPVPLYQDSIPEEVVYILDHAECRMVLVEDQEQADKILSLKGKLPRVEKVIYDDPRGMRYYDKSLFIAFTQVQEMGRELDKKEPELFEALVAQTKGDELAIIPYTSGTTAQPKGVPLTHSNLVWAAKFYTDGEPMYPGDELMAYLPVAWIGDNLFNYAVAFYSGAATNCPEEPETVRRDIKEMGPTFIFAPPRIWENYIADIRVKVEDADWVKRNVANYFMALGIKIAEKQLKNETVEWHERLLHAIGEPFVYGPLRDHLGMRRIRYALTAGAAIAPEVLSFFRGLGVNIKQLYGMTEFAAVGTIQRDGDVKLETVGLPFPGVEMKLTEEGEILVKGPHLMAGYYKNPEATKASLKDGWLHTGDAGILDPDGHFIIIDRVKDVSRLLDETVFAPQYIENKLKFSPYIKEAMAVGHEKAYVTAMLNIDYAVVSNWAERRRIPFAGYPDLAQKPQVYDLVYQEVIKVNRSLPPSQRIKRFVVFHKEFDPDDAEVTRTRKLRRRFMAQKYADIIEALYGGGSEVKVTAVITYEDGRTAQVERVLRIRDVPADAEMVAQKKGR
jgi:long-chain acyl-CoA synthetase